ncbi:MAG: alpha/beta fold hydrolase [Candidatus Omnitrophota bacterium]|nr:alpha/beta fold hydrolase [Candidatus Omnitrophota bacterium]
MKKIYILVATFFVMSVLLFIWSFAYLDKTKHKIYYYTIGMDNHDVGTIKIEKFETEDKLIYKCVSNLPFLPVFTEYRSRLVLDKKYNLESYYRQRSGNGHTERLYAENRKQLVSFVLRFRAEFACLDNIPVNKETFIFEEESPETYLPVIENYNFNKGRSQGFNTLTCLWNGLPPIKRFVTLTSIKDEYLAIDSLGRPLPGRGSRRIKTENLLLKIRNYPEGSIWVAKSDRSIVKLEIPKKNLRIMRTFHPQKLEAKPFILTSEKYRTEDIVFKNKDIQLAGTISVPKKEGRSPAVLLVWGMGPHDRGYMGIFTCVANHLAKNGFSVLRFDKRGTGSSGGSSSVSTDNELAEDVGAALEYLAGRKEVDSARIAVIGHSNGAFYALKAVTLNDIARGIILMAPLIYSNSGDDERLVELNKMAYKFKWTDEYLKLSIRSMGEIREKVRDSNRDWISILRKRCFLKNARERLNEKVTDAIRQVNIPMLILQGKEDNAVLPGAAQLFDDSALRWNSGPNPELSPKDSTELNIPSTSLGIVRPSTGSGRMVSEAETIRGMASSPDHNPERSWRVDKALEEGGNRSNALTYYSYAGGFFGKEVNDGVHKLHYKIDEEVLENMTNWLIKNLPEIPAPEAPAGTGA